MKIEEALKETGKVLGPNKDAKCYAMVSPDGPLQWFYFKDNKPACAVGFLKITTDNWQPYHEVKEIRPEKENEVWKHVDGITYLHDAKGSALRTSRGNELHEYIYKKVVHGKEWERILPKVEDDSVERIEIEKLKKQVDDLNEAIEWALGYDTPHEILFDPPIDHVPRYWWRNPLRQFRDKALEI